MPTFNPLIGRWQLDDNPLVGYGGPEVNGGAGIGYDGTVNSLGDFAKAIGGGAGVVLGGLPGMLGMMGNLAMGNSPVAGLTGLVQSARDWASGTPSAPSSSSAPLIAVHSSDLDPIGGGIMGMEPAGQQVNLDGVGGAGSGSQEAKNAESKGDFAMGGFTGGMEGRPAGVVHGQELVLAAPTVRALGPIADDLARVNALAVERAPMRPRSWAEMVMMQHPDIWNAAA